MICLIDCRVTFIISENYILAFLLQSPSSCQVDSSADFLESNDLRDNRVLARGPEGGSHISVVSDLLHPDEDALFC